MPSLSLKWKISVGFLALSLGFVGAYIGLATQVFEDDRIHFTQSVQQHSLAQLSSAFAADIEDWLLHTRALAEGEHAQARFWENPKLLAISARTERQVRTALEKQPGLLAHVPEHPLAARGPDLRSAGRDRFTLTLKEPGPSGEAQTLAAVVEPGEVLGVPLNGETRALVREGQVVALRGQARAEVIRQAARTAKGRVRIDGDSYLVATSGPVLGHTFVSLVPEHAAMGALGQLRSRSLVFFLMVVFAAISLSLLLSNHLTRGLKSLSAAAVALGQGQAPKIPSVRSRDELGELANALRSMSASILNLRQKTERELQEKTEFRAVKLVQERLLPASAHYRNAHVRVSGFSRTQPEFSGTWYFYRQAGAELFVAVAELGSRSLEGAALAAISRSVFDAIDEPSLSLKQIAERWDKAIHTATAGQARVRASLLKLNVELGDVYALSAGLGAPTRFMHNGVAFHATQLPSEQNAELGSRPGRWFESFATLGEGERVVMHTSVLCPVRVQAECMKVLTRGAPPEDLAQALELSLAPTAAASGLVLDFKSGGRR